MKTAEEILEGLANESFYEGLDIDPNEEYASDGWEPNVKDALRQLCEAIEREVLGEGQVLHDYDMDADGWKEYKKKQFSMKDMDEADQERRAEQRAKLRAFCGVGEQKESDE